MTGYEYDKNTGLLRFGGRVIAKIDAVDSRSEDDLENIFDFFNEYQGFDFDEIRDLIDDAQNVYQKLDPEENIDADSELIYKVYDLIGELSDLEKW